MIEAAKRAGIPVIVDPKAPDYAVYRGATMITPNRRELSAATRREAVGDAAIAEAAAELAGIVACEAVLVTRSEEGMTLHVKGEEPVHVPAYPVKVRDVSGPGDTVVAMLAVMLALGADYESRDARRQRGRRGGGRQARHRDRERRRIAPSPAARRRARARKTRSCSTARVLDARLAEWRRSACASASPTAASTCCIAATSG